VDESKSLPLRNLSLGEDGVDDMCDLDHLHEPAILLNLKKRHAHGNPYTYTGSTCIAVNPYKWLDLYTEDIRAQYLVKPREVSVNQAARCPASRRGPLTPPALPRPRGLPLALRPAQSLPPHAYATSARAFIEMHMQKQNQSVLVSGESGAGKTETVKILMNHLASISAEHQRNLAADLYEGVDRSGQDAVIQKVLQSNPILESFGNAKTVRNNNSSRFGKFVELYFDDASALVGAHCHTYLLEKSRVVGQGGGERAYHSFYQVRVRPQHNTATAHWQPLPGNRSLPPLGGGVPACTAQQEQPLALAAAARCCLATGNRWPMAAANATLPSAAPAAPATARFRFSRQAPPSGAAGRACRGTRRPS
jgi:myosin-5